MIRDTEYKQNPALSPSDLKLYATDLSGFHKQKILGQERQKEKVRIGTEVGSMVDVLFTDNKNFHNYYVAIEEWKATEKVKDIVDRVFDLISEQNNEEVMRQKIREQPVNPPAILELHNYDSFLIKSIDEIGYYPKWTMAARIKAILDKGSEYFEQKKKCDGREMEPLEWVTIAQNKHEQAMKDKYVGRLCRLITGIEEMPGVQIYRQYPMYGTAVINEVEHKIKGLLDTAIVNLGNKTIQPYDIKVAKTLAMFLINARLSRYDIQGDMYDHLIRQTLLLNYPGFTVKPFKFLVIPYAEDRLPEVTHLTAEDYIAGREGMNNGTRLYGWKELVEMVKWHKDKNEWEHYPSFYNTKFITEVKLWSTNDINVTSSAFEININELFD